MKIELVPISELLLDPENARTHDKANLDAIKGSLTEFSQQKPIVVDGEGKVIAGNGTLTAAKELGWDHIAVVRTELTGHKARAFALADNRTAELAAWNQDVLDKTLADLAAMDFDLEGIGFESPNKNFGAGSEEDQGQLDEKKPVTCPECGCEFTT